MSIRTLLAKDRSRIFDILKELNIKKVFKDEEVECAIELADIFLNDNKQKDYEFVSTINDVLEDMTIYTNKITDAIYQDNWFSCQLYIGERATLCRETKDLLNTDEIKNGISYELQPLRIEFWYYLDDMYDATGLTYAIVTNSEQEDWDKVEQYQEEYDYIIDKALLRLENMTSIANELRLDLIT